MGLRGALIVAVVIAIVALVSIARAGKSASVDEIVDCLGDRHPNLVALSRASQDLKPSLARYTLATRAVRFESGPWATIVATRDANTADDAERKMESFRSNAEGARRAGLVERHGDVVIGWSGEPSTAQAAAVRDCAMD